MLSLKKLTSSDKSSNNENLIVKLIENHQDLLKPNIKDQIKNENLTLQSKKLVLSSTDISSTNPTLTGGKGSSLAILNIVKDVDVPPFFCVSTAAFIRQSSKIKENIDKLEKLSNEFRNSDSQKLLNSMFDQANLIRQQIESTEIDSEIKKEIIESYEKLCIECKNTTKDAAVAVRSSATTEDTKEASFAGQHDTYLGQKGEKDVLNSVRKCWASIFTQRAVEYRTRNKIAHEKAIMCVVVQAMVEPVVAGTSFSVEISTGFPAVNIAASYGLGEAVVSGEVTSDEWLVNNNDLSFIKTVIGSKKFEYVMNENGSGTFTRDVSLDKRTKLCMTDDQVVSVAKSTLNIQKLYNIAFFYDNVDTEFAINKHNQVMLLQSRPVVVLNNSDILTVKEAPSGSQIVKASYSLLGAVTGKCKVITNFEDLVEGRIVINSEDIIVTAKTGNYWNQYLTSLKGIVTVDGSPTAHPMLIGRERNLVVLCGIPDLMEKCKNLDGKTITIDGLTKWLYSGELNLVNASKENLESQFTVQKVFRNKSKEETIKFLDQYGRITVENDQIWVRNPNTKLSPAWAKIYSGIYKYRYEFVNSCRTVKLDKDPLCNENKIIDGFNTDLFVEDTVTNQIFERMTLDDAQRYHDLVDLQSQNYLKACKNFEFNPTVANWKSYQEAYKPIYCALWLSFFWRNYLKKLSSSLANKYNVTNFHYDQMLCQAQEEYSHLEEDVKLHNIITGIAEEMRQKVLSEKENLYFTEHGKILTLSEKTIIRCSVMHKDLRAKVSSASRSFRIHKNQDISAESPFPLLLERIVSAIQTGGVQNNNENLLKDRSTNFFPNFPDLNKAINLHIYGRIQNSNCHHWKIRGQWYIRQAFIKISEKLNIDLNKIWDTKTPEEIEKIVAEYEETKIIESGGGSGKFSLPSFLTGTITGLAIGISAYYFSNKKNK